jgi:hypothetical protein
LPILNGGRAELLDHPRLVAQLCALERRTARGGRDSIDHPPGAHDDIANAVAGAIVTASCASGQETPFVMPLVYTRSRGWIDGASLPRNNGVPAHYLAKYDEPWRPYVGADGIITPRSWR